jgi:hypothetical protein
MTGRAVNSFRVIYRSLALSTPTYAAKTLTVWDSRIREVDILISLEIRDDTGRVLLATVSFGQIIVFHASVLSYSPRGDSTSPYCLSDLVSDLQTRATYV